MPTISEQLTQLTQDRDDLVDNLTTKGITGLTGDETFTELVPEILNIPSGGGDYNAKYQEEPSGSYQASSSTSLFYKYITEIQDIDLKNFRAEYYAYTFSDMYELKKVGTISNSNTTIKPTTLLRFFSNDMKLEEVSFNLDTSQCTNFNSMFYSCSKLKELPANINTSSGTNFNQFASSCKEITEVPSYNFSNAQNLSYAFYNCSKLTTVPQFNLGSATNLQAMFGNCPLLTNESLNNILASLISATNYSGTKTLAYIGLTSTQATTCESLSNWNDFVSAGWSKGY